MSNMSYCRFENTFKDLEDCADHITDEDLSKSEKSYRNRLVELCRSICQEADFMESLEEQEDEKLDLAEEQSWDEEVQQDKFLDQSLEEEFNNKD